MPIENKKVLDDKYTIRTFSAAEVIKVKMKFLVACGDILSLDTIKEDVGKLKDSHAVALYFFKVLGGVRVDGLEIIDWAGTIIESALVGTEYKEIKEEADFFGLLSEIVKLNYPDFFQKAQDLAKKGTAQTSGLLIRKKLARNLGTI